ncbi:DUF2262 domain-containing protein [Acaryochloris marina]|uniref:DUF2262 domain-containing protein n=1 Tax=Acaryochloris marina (strain MBIC 11017) TaxID=329726 RepID=B0C993_ACAM1|nr:DUF2262 domain-containing protein [Acaryochloris marina]ABW27774.1 hypothetical protein AM1_2774 [Acaryochloris marina MBIC11017]BDM82503.1 hypothetical protein AM10699_53640 [Acaryochloris marina MBIC10699]
MDHDFLSEITRDGEDGIITIEYEGHTIDIRLISDGQPFGMALQLATEIIEQLPEYDVVAKNIIVNDLCDIYNNGWNEYDEVQADGSLKSVSHPPLTTTEFEQKFFLAGVNITGNTVVELFYDNSGLFWGHAVLVQSLNGSDFNTARAELLG